MHVRCGDETHLRRLKALIERFEPTLISDHLSWSGIDGLRLPDLFPLPYTGEALDRVSENICRAQDALGRRLLIENPSLYLRPDTEEMTEAQFLGELVGRTGCAILLDVNNLYVSTRNLGGAPAGYLAALPKDAIGEIHLAGHKSEDVAGTTVLIDDHGSPVVDEVWRIYHQAVARFGVRPTLIEWDTDVPPLAVLMDEAAKAATIIDRLHTADGTSNHDRAA